MFRITEEEMRIALAPWHWLSSTGTPRGGDSGTKSLQSLCCYRERRREDLSCTDWAEAACQTVAVSRLSLSPIQPEIRGQSLSSLFLSRDSSGSAQVQSKAESHSPAFEEKSCQLFGRISCSKLRVCDILTLTCTRLNATTDAAGG